MKVKATWTKESIHDIAKYHGINAQSELTHLEIEFGKQLAQQKRKLREKKIKRIFRDE